MRTLIILLAVAVSLGAYYSGDRADPAFDPERPMCRSKACQRHAPYRMPRSPGRDWPLHPRTDDPNCELDRRYLPDRPPIPSPDPTDSPPPGSC